MNEIRRFECIRSCKEGEWLTKGKIYELIDNHMIFDDEFRCYLDDEFLTVSNLNDDICGTNLFNYYLNEITESKNLELNNSLIKRIMFNKNATIVFFNDGTKVVSKCDNNDMYNPHVGVAMCLAKKMLGGYDTLDKLVDKYNTKTIEAECVKPRDTDFKIGDTVRIRSWKDMENEFGLDTDKDIKIIPYFTKEMRCLCGKKFIIEKFCGEGSKLQYVYNWYISFDMIEKVEE